MSQLTPNKGDYAFLANAGLQYHVKHLRQMGRLDNKCSPGIWTAKDLKHVYHLRWGIEKSFDDLKNVIGLKSLHSKTPELILQEIFARVVMFNVDALMLDDL